MKKFSRRELFISSSSFVIGASFSFVGSRHWLFNYTEPGKQYILQQKQDELGKKLLPTEGKRIPVSFQGSLKKLAENGVIDLKKWNMLYSKRSVEIPDWIVKAFSSHSEVPIRINKSYAPFLLNILWALGLSNKTKFNEQSPIRGKNLPKFASTAGWTLGKEKNGEAYFNQVSNIYLNEQQEGIALKMAKNIYRPCCNNSTFFQDCNHGSAMLGLLELGASQGKSEEELYTVAFTANLYWFPEIYLKMGLYFEEIEGKNLKDIPPQKLLSREFSSAGGFRGNVFKKLAERKLLPSSKGRSSRRCSV